jgi:hypothetical protein
MALHLKIGLLKRRALLPKNESMAVAIERSCPKMVKQIRMHYFCRALLFLPLINSDDAGQQLAHEYHGGCVTSC